MGSFRIKITPNVLNSALLNAHFYIKSKKYYYKFVFIKVIYTFIKN